MLAGILVGGLSLFLSRKRVRRAFVVAILVVGIGALSFAPLITGWFARGENSQALTDLTGRTNVWSAVWPSPGPRSTPSSGTGCQTTGSTDCPSIPAGWRPIKIKVSSVTSSTAWCWSPFSSLALISPRGPGRAVALFLVVYCTVESFTQTGLGQPSADYLGLGCGDVVADAALATSASQIRDSSPGKIGLTALEPRSSLDVRTPR